MLTWKAKWISNGPGQARTQGHCGVQRRFQSPDWKVSRRRAGEISLQSLFPLKGQRPRSQQPLAEYHLCLRLKAELASI